MSDSVTETNWAGCEKEEMPDAAGRNVHDALVMLVVVTIGIKKLVAGSMGTQSMPTVLPINDTLGDENARMTGEKSNTVTACGNTMLKIGEFCTLYKCNSRNQK
jgi:hypothetical protein